ncbi:hypothetical protein NA57DRAFT_54559 [Rhizodiscina lignyota]|uniref:C3H1-type domain-containing protein n=1 Tax=Rhizodiscina lignyota TaxID=1504668 RepID=A0A9P4IJJ7_9PEZI|nr:hypothetical protein NA57DRAFT_54559 [Rhizodiscina lignyota]
MFSFHDRQNPRRRAPSNTGRPTDLTVKMEKMEEDEEFMSAAPPYPRGRQYLGPPAGQMHPDQAYAPASPDPLANNSGEEPSAYSKQWTCPFWAMGRCEKSAEVCPMAHYSTGVRVRLFDFEGDNTANTAGGFAPAAPTPPAGIRPHTHGIHTARSYMQPTNTTADALMAKEAIIFRREGTVRSAEDSCLHVVTRARKLLDDFDQLVAELSTDAQNTLRMLNGRRDQVLNVLHSQESEGSGEAGNMLLNATDAMVGGLTALEEKTEEVDKSILGKLRKEIGELQKLVAATQK